MNPDDLSGLSRIKLAIGDGTEHHGLDEPLTQVLGLSVEAGGELL